MKKIYHKPAMRVVQLHQRGILCQSTPLSVSRTSTNLTDDDAIEYGGSDETYNGYIR
jgi:hypothetical protein